MNIDMQSTLLENHVFEVGVCDRYSETTAAQETVEIASLTAWEISGEDVS